MRRPWSYFGLNSGTFASQVRLARIWIPLAIVSVVLVWQLAVVPLAGDAWSFWSTLLFYAILGPAVTFLVLDWIAAEVKLREEAQTRLASLFSELQEAHDLLGGIQRVTASFAAAPDLQATLHAAAAGFEEVTGASGSAMSLNFEGVKLDETHGLAPEIAKVAKARGPALLAAPLEKVPAGDGAYWVLQARVRGARDNAGYVQAWFAHRPDERQQEAFDIIVTQLGAAAEAAASRTRDLFILSEVDRTIRAEGNLGRLLHTLLDQMLARAGGGAGAVYLAEEGGLLHLAADRNSDRTGPVPPIRPGQGLIGNVASRGESLLLDEIGPDLRRSAVAPVLADAGSAVLLPMVLEGTLLGVVVLSHPDQRHFTRSGVTLLELLAGQVSWAIRNARAYLYSEELAIAEERARIAREIHDGVAQSLAFSALKLDLIDRLRHKEPDRAAAELHNVRQTVRELIKEVRRSIFALRPVDLERHGFVETLRRYLTDYGQQNEIAVSLEMEDDLQLPLKAETVLFRIFQEAMTNVAKHARANTVAVKAGSSRATVFLEVADDGLGFDLETVGDRVSTAGGLGLKQMRERMQAQGGNLLIDTAPGRGTVLRAELPV